MENIKEIQIRIQDYLAYTGIIKRATVLNKLNEITATITYHNAI
jgi:hypothetical protein